MLTVFGSNLARDKQGLTSDSISGGKLPTTLAFASVYVQDSPAALLYASPTQINFLVPSDQIAGNVTVRVVREGWTGQPVTITLVDSAPAVFTDSSGHILAEDWNAKDALVTADAPAHSGDMVVLYATGLGHAQPNPSPGEIPKTAAVIAAKDLKVLLNGVAVDPSLVKYAGLTPGCAGLYQVNVLLPGDGIGIDPEVRLTVGTQSSQPGVKLVVR